MSGSAGADMEQYFYPSPNQGAERVLAVVFHAFAQSPAVLEGVRQVIRESVSAADIYSPRLPLGIADCDDPEATAAGLLANIDEIVRAAQNAKRRAS